MKQSNEHELDRQPVKCHIQRNMHAKCIRFVALSFLRLLFFFVCALSLLCINSDRILLDKMIISEESLLVRAHWIYNCAIHNCTSDQQAIISIAAIWIFGLFKLCGFIPFLVWFSRLFSSTHIHSHQFESASREQHNILHSNAAAHSECFILRAT